MIHGFGDFARVLVTALLLGVTGAVAQTPHPAATPQGTSAPTAQAGVLPAAPAAPQINIAEITRRANQDVGVDIQTTITGWQRKLDRLESDLRAQRLRYSELNDLRDELQGPSARRSKTSRIICSPRLPPQRLSSICSGRRPPLASRRKAIPSPLIGPNSITSSGCFPRVRLQYIRPIYASIS